MAPESTRRDEDARATLRKLTPAEFRAFRNSVSLALLALWSLAAAINGRSVLISGGVMREAVFRALSIAVCALCVIAVAWATNRVVVEGDVIVRQQALGSGFGFDASGQQAKIAAQVLDAG